jgi:hypothetical protein
MPSTLLALPAELRNVIYTYALTSPTSSLTFIPSTRRFDVSTIGAGLLVTCRSLAEETRYLPLQLNKLVFHMPDFSVGFALFLEKLNELEEEMGWVLRRDVRIVCADGRRRVQWLKVIMNG